MMMARTTRLLCLFLAALLLAACFGGGGGSGYSGPAEPGPSDPTDPTDPVDPPVDPTAARDRYSFNNQCFAMQSKANEQFLVRDGNGYNASAAAIEDAEVFYFKPSSLGHYLLYNTEAQLLTANSSVGNLTLEAASDDNIFSVIGATDSTSYPAAPQYDEEPELSLLNSYREFIDPMGEYEAFTFTANNGQLLTVQEDNSLSTADATDSTDLSQQFFPVATTGCADFPEARSNVGSEKATGTPTSFAGTDSNGNVIGHADVHVHISSSTFLGNAQAGASFHKFGVTHALEDCQEQHGPGGQLDLVGAFLGSDFDGHATDGWPTFTEWPSAENLTHEAIYWKWLERAWQAGLRIAVNDLVDNQTLCELNSNIADFGAECNSQANAQDQVGTMYAMQDYIDAQYGGPGKGFFRIVLDPAEARAEVEKGNLAIILALEISNTLNCKAVYSNPFRTTEPFQETGSIAEGVSYGCTMEEAANPADDAPNSIRGQLTHLWALGVRKIISVHEFDNAFGGNGIFNGFLNVGNRENTGGIPGDVIDGITNPLVNLAGPADLANTITGVLGNLASAQPELPTGEFWSTYDCPEEGGSDTPDKDGNTNPFSGYLWSDTGGVLFENAGLPPNLAPACVYTGLNGRPGGATACYPTDRRQCNARWMSPIGVYMYKKMMEYGFIFDFDHFEMEMKTQALELAEAQPIAYPFVSTHGAFGGIKVEQAERVYKNGGFLYPSIGSSEGLVRDMNESLAIWQRVEADAPSDHDRMFAFGYGSDTNGMSAQAGPRGNICSPTNDTSDCKTPIEYPYTLFSGSMFDDMPQFANVDGVVFHQPAVQDPRNGVSRSWHQDEDGNAHYGMASGIVEEIRLAENPEAMEHLFNSAEKFLRTWERTFDAAAAIRSQGGASDMPEGVLRAAPIPATPFPIAP